MRQLALSVATLIHSRDMTRHQLEELGSSTRGL